MNFLLSEAMIRKLCGNTSYKKGKAYYETGKVNIQNYRIDSSIIEADVLGRDGFHVAVTHDGNGDIHAECTCPTLASVNNYCQHIAAVLLCMKDIQKAGRSTNRLSALPQNELSEEKKGLHSEDASSFSKASTKEIYLKISRHPPVAVSCILIPGKILM